MPKVFVTTRSGELHTLQVDGTLTLMEAIREKGIGELLALCGGCCSCATCHVYVDPKFEGELPQMTTDEDGLLDGSTHRTAGSRLSCQLRVTPTLDGLRVTIAPEN